MESLPGHGGGAANCDDWLFTGRVGFAQTEIVTHSLVMTVLGPDRPGLLAELAGVIDANGGSWFESRLSRFAGQFAGILRFDCPDEKHDRMIEALKSLDNLNVQVVKEGTPPHRSTKSLDFDVRGHHHPGLIRNISATIAQVGGNLEEFITERDAAPQPGHFIFRSIGRVQVVEDFEHSKLRDSLQALGSDLQVIVSPAGENALGQTEGSRALSGSC